MKNVTLNIGGQLAPGDVVGISYNNCIIFGWYVEEGQYGSLKYIPFRVPQYVEDQYNKFLAGDQGAWLLKKFAKGIIFKHMSKDFITSWSAVNNRAIKISNPEEFFRGSDVEPQYLASKTILNNLKFPAK